MKCFNYARLYSVFQRVIVYLAAWVASAFVFAVVAAGIAKTIFNFDEVASLLWVGGPSLILLSILFYTYMPGSLKKAGVLSDEPKSFGSWFKKF
jgi:hypothetical protein